MNLQGLEMRQDDAAKMRAQYAKALREGKTNRPDEDRQILRALQAVEAGATVIDLSAVMNGGGVNELGQPRLAVARPGAAQVRVMINSFETAVFFWNYDRRLARPRPKQNGHDQQRFQIDGVRQNGFFGVLRTIVPNIPPQYRLTRYWAKDRILFEVDKWELEPPVDPALLRHLGGPFYAVLAVWNLTDLERAVLGHTRRDDR